MNVKVVISAAAAIGAAAVTSSTTAWADTGTTVKNPYGLAALWADGDFVSKTTLIILVIMSLGTWYVGILKLFEQSKLFKQGKEAAAKSWRTETMVADVQAQSEESAFRFLAHSTIEAAMSYDAGQSQRVAFDQWLDISAQRAVNVINGRLQGGLPLLATVGSTAPFVGLFGTVWGIYHALTAIGMSGQASIDKVAGPVGEALIMTAMGLAVAVPAVLGYNWLVRRNKVGMERVRHFGASLQMTLLSGR